MVEVAAAMDAVATIMVIPVAAIAVTKQQMKMDKKISHTNMGMADFLLGDSYGFFRIKCSVRKNGGFVKQV